MAPKTERTWLARVADERPVGEAVFILTHATTESFNALQAEFDAAGSGCRTWNPLATTLTAR